MEEVPQHLLLIIIMEEQEEVMQVRLVIQSMATMCNQASALVGGLRIGQMDILLITERIITSVALQIALTHVIITASVLGSTRRMASALIGEVALSVPDHKQVIVATLPHDLAALEQDSNCSGFFY